MKIGILSLVSDVHDPADIAGSSKPILALLKQSFEIKEITLSEIHQVDFAVAIHDQILRFEIPMHDFRGKTMQVLEDLEHLVGNPSRGFFIKSLTRFKGANNRRATVRLN